MTGNTVNAGIAHRLYTEGEKIADTKAPKVPVAGMWEKRKMDAALVKPSWGAALDAQEKKARGTNAR